MLNLTLLQQLLQQQRPQLEAYEQQLLAINNLLSSLTWQDSQLQQSLPLLAQKLELASWDGSFGDVTKHIAKPINYKVLAIDGSQICLDKSSTFSGLGLVQVAGALFTYGATNSSTAYFYQQELIDKRGQVDNDTNNTTEIIRSIVELEQAATWAQQYHPDLLLLDGSLQFLYQQQQQLTGALKARFAQALTALQNSTTNCCFYTSMPQSRNYVELLRHYWCKAAYFNKASCKGECQQPACKTLAYSHDSQFWQALLTPESHSQPFNINFEERQIEERFLNSATTKSSFWPGEIARVESWQKLNWQAALAIILDQTTKGFGYPVALTYAHHQAVISHAEQQAFIHLLKTCCNLKISSGSNKAVYKQHLLI